MQAIIKAQDLGKHYNLSGYVAPYSTFRYKMMRLITKSLLPVRRHDNEQIIWALKDVNFKIAQGEIVGLIGRNGAGKSTLLKILSRVTTPTLGRVDLYGRVASVLEIGTGFHPELTGRENIFLAGASLGLKRKDIYPKFDEIIAFAEIEKFIDTPVKYYSSGMYLRLAFAAMVHFGTEILIIDEVLAITDAAFQQRCLGKIKDVATQGITVILVNHNIGVISRLCNMCLLLDRGHLIESGPPMSVIQTYVTSGLFQQPEREVSWKDVAFQAAHKLGNPVFALETNLQGIKRNIQADPNKALELAHEMEVSIEKAKAIIEQSKLFIRAHDNLPHLISVVPLLESSARVAEDNGVTVQINVNNQYPRVFVDPIRIAECFDELFANSLHWFNKEEKKIKIDIDIPSKKELPRMLNSSLKYVRIKFTDNGCGIPLGSKEKIFEPFYTTYPHGTGLGLSLVRQVIEWHGGMISENGNSSEGAYFEIFLPQVASNERDTKVV